MIVHYVGMILILQVASNPAPSTTRTMDEPSGALAEIVQRFALQQDAFRMDARWSGRCEVYQVLGELQRTAKEPECAWQALVVKRHCGAAVATRPTEPPQELQSILKQLLHASDTIADWLFDGLMKEALVVHFIERRPKNAAELYRLAIRLLELNDGTHNERDLIPSPARQSNERVWYSALCPASGGRTHRDAIKELIGLAAKGTVELDRHGGEASGTRTIPRWVHELPPVLTLNKDDLAVQAILNEVVRQALVAEVWCNDATNARELYELAAKLCDLQSSTDKRLYEFILAKCAPARARVTKVEFRSWLEPGFIAAYDRVLAEARHAALIESNATSAIALLEEARALAAGLEGSARIDNTDKIDKYISELSK